MSSTALGTAILTFGWIGRCPVRRFECRWSVSAFSQWMHRVTLCHRLLMFYLQNSTRSLVRQCQLRLRFVCADQDCRPHMLIGCLALSVHSLRELPPRYLRLTNRLAG